MTNDNISDMLTRIRKRKFSKHTFTRVIYSKVNLAILKVFVTEGYIKDYQIENLFLVDQIEIPGKNISKLKIIKIYLKYKGWWIKKSFFSILKRISKPGKRIFSGYKNFNNFVNVLKYEQGIAIISTSSGVMSHLKATKLKKGGEILCYIG